jgi:general secretion pathway protein K
MKTQRGLAAVTAIMIVAVAAAAATLMLSQQSAMLDQTAMVVGRAQADMYAHAGVDWARGVLMADRNVAIDSLDEPWAQPIAALPVDRAIVAGRIVDEQGKFNLNSLVGTNPIEAKATLQALLGDLGLSQDLADVVLDWIDPGDALSPNGAEDAYYLSLPKPYRTPNAPMDQVEELYRLRGFDAAAVGKLRPFVTALPATVPLNVNTAPVEVLRALAPAFQPAQLAKLAGIRRDKPFADVASFKASLASFGVVLNNIPLDVKSAFFNVRVDVAQDEVRLGTEALVQREGTAVAIIWRRPRS